MLARPSVFKARGPSVTQSLHPHVRLQMTSTTRTRWPTCSPPMAGLRSRSDPRRRRHPLQHLFVREKAQERVFHELGRVARLEGDQAGLSSAVGAVWQARRAPRSSSVRLMSISSFRSADLAPAPGLDPRAPRDGKRRSISRSCHREFTSCRLRRSRAPAPSCRSWRFSKYCTFCVVPYTRGERYRAVRRRASRNRRPRRQGVVEITYWGRM